MLTATKRKVTYALLAVAALLLLASTPMIVPSAFAGECPGASSGSC